MSKYLFWLKTAVIFQILTAIIHSLSFFSEPVARNETEKQLLDLITNYQSDLGAGFSRSFQDLFTALSACFTLLCLFGGLINIYLIRKNASQDILKGVLNINILVFGFCFILMALFTFLPPIVLTGMIFLSLIASRIIMTKEN